LPIKPGREGRGVAGSKLVTGPRSGAWSGFDSEPITGPTNGLTNEPGKGEPKNGLMIEPSKGLTADVTGFSKFVTGFSRLVIGFSKFVTGFNRGEVKPLIGLMMGMVASGVSETGDASSIRVSRNSTFKCVDADFCPVRGPFCQDRNQWVSDIGVTT
jgi:hypothetical protein